MLIPLLTLYVLAAAPGGAELPSDDFARSYHVWVSVYDGRCGYNMTDATENAKQLQHSLRNPVYDKSAGMELLIDERTPPRCVDEARRAVSRAGFKKIRVRRGTNSDRGGGPFD